MLGWLEMEGFLLGEDDDVKPVLVLGSTFG
jgi:hypothetical protein